MSETGRLEAMAPTKSTGATVKPDEAPPAPDTTTPEDQATEEVEDGPKRSTEELTAGRFLGHRAGLAVVTGGGTGEATVLVLRAGDHPQERSVTVYATEAEAADSGLEHVAWHLP
jgi:hypothetical protein